MKTMTCTEFRKNASKVLDLVEGGETVRVLRHGKAIAKLTPVSSRASRPSWKQPGLRLIKDGASICKAILEERRSSL
ncbi:MAG: type II toxin-antitoxin system prevent-host-death family antitoxin [Acidobacteria bacterium]|nr:type II toxin-antitoxin system prevent-host-death family antitoxin [Acidobacteriota bacterium]